MVIIRGSRRIIICCQQWSEILKAKIYRTRLIQLCHDGWLENYTRGCIEGNIKLHRMIWYRSHLWRGQGGKW